MFTETLVRDHLAIYQNQGTQKKNQFEEQAFASCIVENFDTKQSHKYEWAVKLLNEASQKEATANFCQCFPLEYTYDNENYLGEGRQIIWKGKQVGLINTDMPINRRGTCSDLTIIRSFDDETFDLLGNIAADTVRMAAWQDAYVESGSRPTIRIPNVDSFLNLAKFGHERGHVMTYNSSRYDQNLATRAHAKLQYERLLKETVGEYQSHDWAEEFKEIHSYVGESMNEEEALALLQMEFVAWEDAFEWITEIYQFLEIDDTQLMSETEAYAASAFSSYVFKVHELFKKNG